MGKPTLLLALERRYFIIHFGLEILFYSANLEQIWQFLAYFCFYYCRGNFNN